MAWQSPSAGHAGANLPVSGERRSSQRVLGDVVAVTYDPAPRAVGSG